jgi:hypothetical protein
MKSTKAGVDLGALQQEVEAATTNWKRCNNALAKAQLAFAEAETRYSQAKAALGAGGQAVYSATKLPL